MESRVRSRGTGFALNPTVTQFAADYDCPGSPPVVDYVFPRILVGYSETMTDIVIPRFRERRAGGEVFFNNLDHVKESISVVLKRPYGFTNSALSCGAPVRHGRFYTDGTTAPGLLVLLGYVTVSSKPPLVTVLTTGAISDLITEVSTKVQSDRHKSLSNLYEDIAEANQTYRMLKKPLAALESFSKKLPIARSLEAASSYWLQYRYGVMPLINTVTEVALGIKAKRRAVRKTTRAKGVITRSSFASTNHDLGGQWRYTVAISSTDTLTVRAMSLDAYYSDALYESGLSLSGFVTLPWELIPYSFVADWFVNVQDYLGALVPSPSFEDLGSCYVATRDTITKYNVAITANLNPSTGTLTSSPDGDVISQLVTKTRRPLVKPALVIKSDFRFDAQHPFRTLDSLALISQRFLKAFTYRR